MRHALITAGTKGLGRKVSEALKEKGYTLTVTYRKKDEAYYRMKKQWEEESSRIQFVQGDMVSKQDVERMVEEAYTAFGRLDVVVNNAGPYIFEKKQLADYSDEEWHRMIDGNLSAAFHLARKAIPIMRRQQFGRFVTYGFQNAPTAPGWIYRSAYAAAKSGLVSLTKSISLEEASHGITANMVCPGVVTGDFKEADIHEGREVTDHSVPVGRPATGGDIARTILFLTDDDADMITGSVIEVTGGVDVLHKRR